MCDIRHFKALLVFGNDDSHAKNPFLKTKNRRYKVGKFNFFPKHETSSGETVRAKVDFASQLHVSQTHTSECIGRF